MQSESKEARLSKTLSRLSTQSPAAIFKLKRVGSPLGMMCEARSDLVLRFWYAPDEAQLPDEESLRAAKSWKKFQQVIFTNVPEEVWRKHDIDYDIVSYSPPSCGKGVSPQHLKDFWQFQMPQRYDGAWCVDWDFVLVDKSKLPRGSIVVSTERVKTAGGRTPKDVVREGVRCHLGITKFPRKCPIAEEIQSDIQAHLPKLVGVNKSHPKWMDNTLIAQRILLANGHEFVNPVVLNPYPLWMTKPHFGRTLHNTKMPSASEAKEFTATFTLWAGYANFPREAVAGIFTDEVTETDVLRLLDGVSFPDSERNGVTVHALNIGMVKPRGEQVVTSSAFTRDNPVVAQRLVRWARETIRIDVGDHFQFIGLYITKDFPLEARHRDVHNHGQAQAWRTIGDFIGGQLWHWPKDAGGEANG